MRGAFDFDPNQCEYGAATTSIRQILSEWASIDWFVPPRDPAAEARAAELLGQHNARARPHLPEAFPANLETRSVRGGWGEFAALCSQVRTQPWDWKYSALKRLSSAHSKARGWTPLGHAQRYLSLEAGAPPRPGDLFVHIHDNVFWMALSPKLDLKAGLPHDYVEPAGWYLGYAEMDILECIEWQLAEDSNDLEGNPFLPLLRCYAGGFYPFSLDLTTLVMFAMNP